eukprot:120297-Karenia_brevis.AAC.1
MKDRLDPSRANPKVQAMKQPCRRTEMLIPELKNKAPVINDMSQPNCNDSSRRTKYNFQRWPN